MKKLLFLVLMLSTTLSFAQTAGPGANGLPQYNSRPQVFKSWSDFTYNFYEDAAQFIGAEVTTSRNYTVLGTYPLLIDSAAFRNDTITLSQSNLGKGQIIKVLANGSTNDTLTVLHDGSFNGATTNPAFISPATAPAIKRSTIYVDSKGNYWTLQ